MKLKSIVTLLLAGALMLSFTACGNTPASNGEGTGTGSETVTETAADTNTSAEDTIIPEDTSAVTDETMGSALLADFKTRMDTDASQTALALAEGLIVNPVIQFSGGAVEVAEGYLSGFTTEITGFSEGAMFAPMIGSIAFVGYVFKLAEDADVAAFVTTLKENADLRWNICVEADEMICEAVGNTVFFVMCPNAIEE